MVGNFIGAYIIEDLSGPTFFLLMGILMWVPSLAFFLIRYPEQLEPSEAPSTPSDLQEKKSFLQVVIETLKLIPNRKMMFMNLQFIWTGISIAYFSGNLTPIMVLNLADTDYTEKHK